MSKFDIFSIDEDIGFDLFEISKKYTGLEYDIYAYDSEALHSKDEKEPCVFIFEDEKKHNTLKLAIETGNVIEGEFDHEVNLEPIQKFIKKVKPGLLKLLEVSDMEEYSSFDFYNEYLKEPK